MKNGPDYSIFYRQDAMPSKAARALDYKAGFKMGKRAAKGDFDLAGFLTDARVLASRYGSAIVAARLMGVADEGMKGFLDAAGLGLADEMFGPPLPAPWYMPTKPFRAPRAAKQARGVAL